MQARLAEINAARAALSINELRERFFAMPPVPWGDQPAAHQPSMPALGPQGEA
ncbi:MAG TPA: hypothetical protein VER79_05085 [Candidatus Limnocylindrales bacterium]|nr:hypothetical protein [Candidatus Limnocylindrales bacterium]